MTESGEREAEVTETTAREEADESRPGVEAQTAADRTAQRFLELESELDAGGGAPPEGERRRGQVVDAERVDAAEIPSSYPADIGGAALALEVELESGRRVPVFLDWPADGTSDRDTELGRLLSALGVPADALAELYGAELLLAVEDGHYTVYTPDSAPRGTQHGWVGILAGVFFNLLSPLALATGLLSGNLFLLVFLVVNLVVLPLSTYSDAWNLRTTTDWEGGPLFWATLAFVPGVNVLSSALYFLGRGRARPVAP